MRPQSLFEFLAANGGLRSDDKLISEVRESLGSNVMVPRFGPLVRHAVQLSTAALRGGHKAPMFLDTARELCVAAGYLFDDGEFSAGVSRSTVNDLLRAIDDEARDNKRYPFGELPFEPLEVATDIDETDEIPF